MPCEQHDTECKHAGLESGRASKATFFVRVQLIVFDGLHCIEETIEIEVGASCSIA